MLKLDSLNYRSQPATDKPNQKKNKNKPHFQEVMSH